jgi:hypothetical protein
MTDLRDLITTFNHQKKEMIERCEKELKPYLQSLCTELIPEYMFYVYTPNFNDGDPCHYGVYGIYFKIPSLENDPEYSDYTDESGFIHEDDFEPEDGSVIENDYDKIKRAIEAIPLEIMENALGDGYEVRVHSSRVALLDYHNHD